MVSRSDVRFLPDRGNARSVQTGQAARARGEGPFLSLPAGINQDGSDPKTFLLVTYGLSFLGTDVPEVDNPSNIPPLIFQQPPRMPIDQEEYYPK